MMMNRWSSVAFLAAGVAMGAAAARWVPPVTMTFQQPGGSMEARLGLRLMAIQQKQDATWTALRLLAQQIEQQRAIEEAHQGWIQGAYAWGREVDAQMWSLRERQAALAAADVRMRVARGDGRFEMIDSQQ